MIYPSDIEVKLGFDSVRDYILSLCNSQMGREEVKGMSFNSDFNHIVRSLSETNEMLGLIRRGIHTPVESVVDIIDELNRIKVPGSYLKGETYNKVNKMIDTMREVRSFFSASKEEDTGKEFPFLSQVVDPLEAFPEISNEISRIINKFGEVKDSASPKLAEIRREKSQASGSVSRVMNRILASAISEGIVESGVTPAVRDGRIVIPVPAGLKRKIPGIVHDESATGKTVFIEPSQVVEVANKVRELEMEEQREVIAILVALADFMRPHIDEIASSTRILGYLDFVCAKAKYAEIVDAAMPVIEKVTEIEYYHAIHPVLLLNLRKQNREVVPLDICLNQKDRLLVISGPNAGGKSVCLKTVGIVQYMTQCGVLPTVYSNSHIGVFKSMFIDIGDQQSMENDLSTYSSHLRNMKYFISNATNRTLILADEIGSGTEPQIGGAIAQAILHRLSVSGCLGIVTTHYQNLKTFAEETEGMLNAAMLYDRQQLRPLFQLSVGSPGSSFAIEIARNIGLPSDVLDEAKEIVGSDYVNMDKYLLDISRDKRYWANKRQNIREKEAKLDSLLEKYESTASDLKTRRAEIIRDAREQAKEIMQSANAKLEKAIRDIRNAEAEKEQTKKIRRELEEYKKSLNEEIDDAAKLPDSLKPLKHKSNAAKREKNNKVSQKLNVSKDLAVGDYVKIADGGVVGKIISITGKKAEVAFGSLRTITELSKLKAAKKPKETAASQPLRITASTDEDSRKRQLNFRQEIDVRGMRTDEALQAVTYFIDDAIQFNASKLRILHGTGHGILRTMIRQQLKANPVVRDFYDEDVRFGGAGITIVDLD